MTPAPAEQHVHVAIVGTGFAGLGAAIRLKQEGYADFVLFERADRVGGVWRDNSYPGCACDVESHLYSFSFAPNPHWSRAFSPQPEILRYLQGCAERFDLLPHVRFHTELTGARYDEDAQLWRVETSRGNYTARFLVAAMGALSEPSIPNLPGLDSFQGKTFHSALWDHDYDLTDKRVATLGTGASAVQFIPEIQPKVRELRVFQRTPAWVLPRMDRAITKRERWLFERVPSLRKALRAQIYARREALVLAFRNPKLMKITEQFARSYLRRTIADPVLRDKLTPNFAVGCKRILVTADYLPALTQPNVEVVTDGIREVRPHGIVTRDGREHAVDAIIFGTGFKVTDFPFARRVWGRQGRQLHAEWHGSPKALLGTTVANFPNLFILSGPNTGLGHTSVILMIEAQLQLMLEAIDHLKQQGLACVEPRAEAVERFAAQMDRELDGTVWNSGGCDSWYLDETGRNSTLWPSFTFSFMRAAHFRPEDYRFEAPRDHGSDPGRGKRRALRPVNRLVKTLGRAVKQVA